MPESNFDNATLRLLIEDQDGIVTTAQLQQTDTLVNIRSYTTTFTDSQIKTMLSAKVVIPASDTMNYERLPTELFYPVSGYGIFDAAHGAYQGWSGSQPGFLFYWGSDASQPIGFASKTSSANPYVDAYPFENGAKKSFYSFTFPNIGFSPDDLLDNSVAILLNNESNLTGGNSSNSFTVTINYFRITL